MCVTGGFSQIGSHIVLGHYSVTNSNGMHLNLNYDFNHWKTVFLKILWSLKVNFRSWASNCPQLNTLAKQDKVGDENTTTNILGLQWNTITDTLCFPCQTITPENSTLITKREILQCSSKIFDPLGFLFPVTIRAKLFMQSFWQNALTGMSHWIKIYRTNGSLLQWTSKMLPLW